jgi:hypothetical protein
MFEVLDKNVRERVKKLQRFVGVIYYLADTPSTFFHDVQDHY